MSFDMPEVSAKISFAIFSISPDSIIALTLSMASFVIRYIAGSPSYSHEEYEEIAL